VSASGRWRKDDGRRRRGETRVSISDGEHQSDAAGDPHRGYASDLFAASSRILELGTLAGYSAIWLAHALPEDGQLVTLELDGKHAAVARENITRAGLSSAVQIVVGAAVETLTKMISDGTAPFDFIFIDADKPSYPSYLTLTVDLSHVGTVIIADNIVRRGAVIHSDTTDPKVQGVRRFNDLVSNHPRLEATMLQTVGSKGYDGFVFARVAR